MNWELLKVVGKREVIETHWKLLNHLDLVEREMRKISHNLRSEIMLSDTRCNRWMEPFIKERGDNGGFEYEYYENSRIEWGGF